MKAIKYSLIAIAAMVAVSCAKEITPEAGQTPETNPNLVEITLTATGESDEETKAVFSGYPKIAWEGNEEISLLGTNTGNQKLTTTTKGHQATFTGYADITDEVYYAVYPYDSNVSLTAEGKLSNVTVPAVQTATAGSFDPKAYIAVAKSTDKESLYFKAVGAFVKFKLEDAENVKSVTMVSNSGANMACSATIVMNENGGVSHGSPYVDGTASSSVKMVGDFQTDKAYFMVVRPQPYTGGVTFYIEYKDGTVLSRTGASALFESGMARNYIRNLNTLQKKDFNPVTDLYTLFNMGYDIQIAGKMYNKETLKLQPVLINAESISLEITDNGLYFIDPSVTGASINRSNGFSNLYIIGNNPAVKSSIKLAATVRCGQNSNVCLKNLTIAQFDNNMFVHNNNNAIVNRIAFDACDIILPANKSLVFNEDTRSVNELALHNCDIEVTSNTQSVITGRENYNTVDIFNNIFYAETDMTTFKLFRQDQVTAATPKPASIADLSVVNNTFINVYPEKNNNFGYVYAYEVTNSFTYKNNLFELKNFTENSGTYRNFLFASNGVYPTTKTFAQGYMYADPNASGCCIKAWGGADNPGTTYGTAVSAFTNMDYSTPEFTKTSARTSNGATR